MGTNHDIPDLDVFGKGRGDFRLPCGYVDDAGRVFNHIYLREMMGTEDDILDDDELHISERMSRVLVNCTEKLTTEATMSGAPSEITDRKVIQDAICDTLERGLPFSIPDRTAAMLFLRRISVGDIYHINRKCIACNKENKGRHINLSSLAIHYCKDPLKRRVRVKLQRSGMEAVLRVLSASGERRVAELRPNMQNVKSIAILARLESLNGKPMAGNNEDDLNVVKNLPSSDRRLLLNPSHCLDGTIDTDLQFKCNSQSCGEKIEFDLDLGQVFFSNPEVEVKAEALDWI